MNQNLVCVNCFKDIVISQDTVTLCPHCGFDNSGENIKGALPYRTMLKNRYILGKVTLANSEGFTYSAYDTQENKKVDIREFFPMTLGYRDEKMVKSSKLKADFFDKLYYDFVMNANSLLKIKHLSGIVSVIDLIPENNTCYVVYEHHDSVSLKSYIENSGGKIDYNKFQELFIPLMSSLSTIHSLGIKHLGISPQTLRVCSDGKMRLSEWSIESLRILDSGIKADISNSCMAYEQYLSGTARKEYTDIYGFAACIFYAISGKEMLGIKERISNPKLMISREVANTFPEKMLRALSGALQIKPTERTASFEAFKMELTAKEKITQTISEDEHVKDIPEFKISKAKKSLHPKLWMSLSFVIALIVIFFAGRNYVQKNNITLNTLIDKTQSLIATDLDVIISVPDMVGDYYIDWVSKMSTSTNYKFTIVMEEEFSDTVAQGRIISQTPEAEESLIQYGEVTIVVSLGSQMRYLPKINGYSLEEAEEALAEEGLTLVPVYSYSSDTPAGCVMWYVGDISYGDEILYGSSVEVYISSGS